MVRKHISENASWHNLVILICFGFAFAGCKVPADHEFEKFKDRAKQVIEPGKLQEWATSEAAHHENGYKIDTEDLPSWIKAADPEAYPRAFVSDADGPQNRIVIVTFGSGFGHCGILAGKKNYIAGKANAHLKIVEWVRGVYFFREKT